MAEGAREAASVAAGVGWKALAGMAGGAGVGAALAAFVVMCMTRPRDDREWRVALVSTVMSSICGGAAAIRYLGLNAWADDPFGAAGLIGVVFACGLPGWAVVRWVFNWLHKREGKDIGEIIDEVRGKRAAGEP